MKIFSVYNPLKKCINTLKKVVSPSSSAETAAGSASEVLANQNKALLLRASNQIEPEQVKFKSTKEMFAYAKKKCIDALNSETPHEYSLVMDTKQNRVIAEYNGDAHNCSMLNFDSLKLDPENTAVMHGHPDSYPLSSTDVKLLLNKEFNQVIAVDKKGQFSMMYKKPGETVAKPDSKAYINFDNECMDNADTFHDMPDAYMKKGLIDYTLRNNADNLGLRYITNYDYLRK